MPTEERISEILANLDDYIRTYRPRRPEFSVRCPICTHPDCLLFSRLLLTKERKVAEIARELDVFPQSVKHHFTYCLVKRGGAQYDDLYDRTEHARRGYPILGKPVAKKKWLLEELLYNRSELLKSAKSGKVDTRQLSRLAQDISKAADDLEQERAKIREARREQLGNKKREEELEDLTEEQRREMRLVGNRSEETSGEHGPNGKAQV